MWGPRSIGFKDRLAGWNTAVVVVDIPTLADHWHCTDQRLPLSAHLSMAIYGLTHSLTLSINSNIFLILCFNKGVNFVFKNSNQIWCRELYLANIHCSGLSSWGRIWVQNKSNLSWKLWNVCHLIYSINSTNIRNGNYNNGCMFYKGLITDIRENIQLGQYFSIYRWHYRQLTISIT